MTAPSAAILSPEKQRLLELMRRRQAAPFQTTAPFQLLEPADRAALDEDLEDAYPLGGIQLGMLFHMQLAATGHKPAAYHNVSTFRIRLRRPFELAAFQEAVDAAVTRHPIYRTRFEMERYSEPLQLVQKTAVLKVAYHDLAEQSAEQIESELRAFIEAENQCPIAMDQAPLIRLHVHRHAADLISLSLTEPHSIADGWSTHLTLVEIFQHYLARCAGRPLPNPAPLAVAYRDFIRLEREAIAAPASQRFWAEQLNQVVACEPRGWSRSGVPGFGDHKLHQDIPPNTVQALRAWCLRHGFPLKSLFLAIHLRVLSLVTGQEQVTTGLVFNGRPEVPDGDKVAGLFLNTLPLSLRLGHEDWRARVAQAMAAESAILPHRRYPLSLLQAKQRRRLFDTAFCFLHFHSVQDLAAERELEVLQTTDLSLTNFELMVIVRANPADENGVRLVLQSHLERLDQRQLAWLRDYFMAAIEDVIADVPGSQPMPAAERERLEQGSLALTRQPSLRTALAELAPAALAALLSGPEHGSLRVVLRDAQDRPVAVGVSAPIQVSSPSLAHLPGARPDTQAPGSWLLALERHGYFTAEGELQLDEAEEARDLAWWRAYLEGIVPVLPLPLQPQPNTALTQETVVLELDRALDQASALAALAGLLRRYAGQDELALNVGDAYGRFWPLALSLPGTARPEQTLLAVTAQLRETAAHRALSARTVAALLPQSEAGSPWTIAFGPQVPASGERAAVLTWRHELLPDGTRLSLHYAGSPYDQTQAQRFARHYQCLLLSDRPWHEVDLLDESERHQVLAAWCDSAPVTPGPWIHQLIEAQAAQTPERIALSFEGEQLSYGELERRSAALAARLMARGVGLEVFVGVCAERSLELVLALVGILRAGGAYLPLPPEYPSERLREMIAQSGACLVLVQAPQRAALEGAGAELLDLEESCAGTDAPVLLQRRDCALDHSAYLIFTSGSTGRPKGVACGHVGLRQRIVWLFDPFPLTAHDRVLQKTSFGFDVSVWEFFWPLCRGARLVVARPGGQGDPDYLRAVIERERISVLHFVPSMLVAFLDLAGQAEAGSLKWVFCSGEALTPALQARFFARFPARSGVSLHNFYGLTETAVDMSYWACRRDQAPDTVPIGRPFAGMRWYVLDRGLQPTAVALSGELYISGAGLARCYHGRPQLTASRFLPDPFAEQPGERLYRSGDLARYYPHGHPFEGSVDFLGRADHQVKLRGYRIELGEIAHALSALAEIREAVVLARPDHKGELALVAYLRLEPEVVLDPAALQAALASRLPRFMVPTQYVAVERFPLTSSGKLDQRALPAPRTSAASEAARRPLRPIEARLAEIWATALRLPEVGPRDNFFDLGGHSLNLLEVRRLVKSRLGRTVSLVELFQYPTIQALGQFLEPDAQPQVALAPILPSPGARAAIAVIGMAGRFPGAPDLERFWHNLVTGTVSIATLGDDVLPAEHLASGLAHQPHYVRAKGLIEGIAEFDADFFRVPPREAQVTDPQHRLFLELAWSALEQAALDPQTFPGRIGVFAGAALGTYGYNNVLSHPELVQDLGQQFYLANDSAYLATKVAYKLGLTGPALSIQTACSTGLVAIVLACRALQAGECELALAGSVAVSPKQHAGYLHREGGITSRDGRCRPFDANASGTVPGHGLGAVVLEPLERALAGGSPILAVVTGFATNNDGNDKAGFTAPSVSGQARVIREALAMSGAAPQTIDYVETHGTGTPLGDPIELAALKLAHGEIHTSQPYCALGAVKANIGHLDTAAGVAGFIKVVLALQHGAIPGNPLYERENPELGLTGSPFQIQRQTQAWPDPGPRPRRAAVSSFGIGGTNAHVVLEQAPPRPEPSETPGPWLFPFSARSAQSLRELAQALAAYLERHPQLSPAAVAATLQLGRRHFAHRGFVLATRTAEAATRLRQWLAAQPPAAARDAAEAALLELGQAWCGGGTFDGQALSAPGQTRLALPGTPFDRQRYWLEPAAPQQASAVPAPAPTAPGPCFLPGWKLALMPTRAALAKPTTWLVFANRGPLCQAVLERLRAAGQDVVEVQAGPRFQRQTARAYSLDPQSLADYQRLGDHLAEDHLAPVHLVHFWNLGPLNARGDQLAPYFELIHLAQTLLTRFQSRPLSLNLVADRVFAVESSDPLAPERALLLGPAKVIPREFPRVVCRFADVREGTSAARDARLAEALLAEWATDPAQAARFTAISAYRGSKRWVLDYTAADLSQLDPTPLLRPRGCYLITGGLGAIGLALADYLARACNARLVLTARHLPAAADPALRALEAAGAELLVADVDVADRAAMTELLTRAEQRFGPLAGVIHAAGVAGGGVISLANAEASARVLRAKLDGTLVLAELLASRAPAFVALCSSVTAILGGPGQVDYCAANAFLDAFAQARAAEGAPWFSINWDTWREVGMAVNAAQGHDSHSQARQENLRHGLATAQAVQAFASVLAAGQPQFVVSARDFAALTDRAAALRHDAAPEPAAFRVTQRFPRPELAAEFVAPSSPAERAIAAIWEDMIGLQRVGIDDNFFELGGDSLLGLQIVDRINRELGAALTAAGLYEAPTVAAVARLATAAPGQPAPALEHSQERGSSRKDLIRNKRKPQRSGAHE